MFRYLRSIFSAKRNRDFVRSQVDHVSEQAREVHDHSCDMITGPNSFEDLLRLLGDEDARIRCGAVVRLAETCHQIMRRKEENDQTKAAVNAIAKLLVTDSDEIIHHNIGVCLCHNGCPDPGLVMAELVEATTSKHASARVAAAECLSQFGREASEGVPALLRLLRDSEQSVRLSSLKALQSIGPGAKESVPLVVEFLRSPHDNERAAAARAIGAVRDDAEIVIPVLLESLTDGKNYLPPNSNRDVFIDDHIRYATAPIHYVVVALGQFPDDSSRITPDLTKVLCYDDLLLQGLTLGSLASLRDPGAVPAIIGVLCRLQGGSESQTERAVCDAACCTLGAIGPAASSATAVLVEMLQGNEPNLSAIVTLGQVAPSASVAIPVLRKCLRDHPTHVSYRAAIALWKVSGEVAEASATLWGIFRAEDVSTSERLDAGLVLIEMDNNYAAAVAATVFAIVDKTEGWEQKMAVQVLAECGPAAERAVPWLEQAVSDVAAIEDVEGGYDRIDLAASAAVALARIQSDTSHVMAPLINMLADKSWRKRISAAEALGALGSQGQAALPALRSVLHDGDGSVRNSAFHAIKSIEGARQHRVHPTLCCSPFWFWYSEYWFE